MNTLPYSIDDLYWFVLIANAGSLSAAARRYDIAKSTLSNRLSRLESALNIKLLNRNTNANSLTDAGTIFLNEVAPLFDHIETLTTNLADLEIHPKGRIRIAASGTFGKLVVLPLISKFLLQHLHIDIEIDLTDKKIDIISEGYDLAIRLGNLEDSTLYAQKIGRVRRVLCASPTYVNTYGIPEFPEQLLDHDFISHHRELSKINLLKDDHIRNFKINTHLTVTPSEHALAAVEANLGIAAVAEIQVAKKFVDAQLIHVLPNWSLIPEDIYLVTPDRKYRTLALRLCLEFLKTEIPLQIEKLIEA